MAYSYQDFPSVTPGANLVITDFDFLEQADVSVEVDGIAVDDTKYTWSASKTITVLSGFPSGAITRVQRNTPIDSYNSQEGSTNLDWEGLNENTERLFMALQEGRDGEDSRQAVIDNLDNTISTAISDMQTIKSDTVEEVTALKADTQTIKDQTATIKTDVEELRDETATIRDQAGDFATAAGVSANSSATSAANAQTSESAVFAAAVPIGTPLMRTDNIIPPGYLRWGEGGSYDPAVYPDFAAYMSTNYPSLAAGTLPDFQNYSPRTVGPLAPAVGEKQEDAFQGFHIGTSSGKLGDYGLNVSGGGAQVGAIRNDITNPAVPITDGVHGTPRIASETRTKSFGVRWVIKAYGAFVDTGTASMVAIEQAQQFMVRFDAQTLSAPQKLQARRNVGSGWGVLYETALSGQSVVDFTDLGGYDLIRVCGIYRSVASLPTLLMRLSSDNGATFFSNTNHVAQYSGIYGGTRSDGQTTGGAAFYANTFGTLPGYDQVFDLTIHGFNRSGAKFVLGQSSGITNSSAMYHGFFSSLSTVGDTAVMNAIRLFPSSGNFDTTGFIRVEGWKK